MASEAKVRVVLDVSQARQEAERIRESERIVADHKKRAKRTWDKAAGATARKEAKIEQDRLKRTSEQYGFDVSFLRTLLGKGIQRPSAPLAERLKEFVKDKRDAFVFGRAAPLMKTLREGGVLTAGERAALAGGAVLGGVALGIGIAARAERYGAGVEEFLATLGLATQGGAISQLGSDYRAVKAKIMGHVEAFKESARFAATQSMLGQTVKSDVLAQTYGGTQSMLEMRANADGHFVDAKARLFAHGVVMQSARALAVKASEATHHVVSTFKIR